MLILPAVIYLLAPGMSLAQTSGTDPSADLVKQGNDALASRRYDDAIKAFKKANHLRNDSCSDCYFEMAVAQMKMGESDDALKSCDRAISCASSDLARTSIHTLKGNILQSLGDDPKKLKTAESEYRAALQIDASSVTAHFNLGVVLLRESQEAEGISELKSYLLLAPDGPNVTYAKKLIASPKSADEALAPEFKVQTLDGEEISLEQLAGKIVVMDFWATWCPPCVSSVPELKALTKKYPSSKLVLISFSADNDEQAWRQFISKKDMEWPQYWDHDGRIRAAFGVQAFPTYLVIDPQGFIQQRIVGLNPQQSVVARLKDTLQAMFPPE
ncbi:MAG TPA: redoxin domain-containing protein [Candidatus Acidoferrales bacterium]|nr:redoxin domain-containing protein [Candidatus Acidoferrales bacterium]